MFKWDWFINAFFRGLVEVRDEDDHVKTHKKIYYILYTETVLKCKQP